MTTDTKKRVKLYALNAERQWDDRGTGHVSSQYVERLRGMSLMVRAEADGSLLLESKIQPDTAYQKQQDTLIVWSEGDNFDLALSFQEKAGCDEIWEKICIVQGKDPSVEVTQDIVEESEDERFEEMSDSAPPIELPPCELSRLEDISEAIASGLATPIRKEKLAMALEQEGYIEKLLNLFHICEDLENIEGLHHLFEIFKNIFLLNKNALFEIMFSEDTIFDVVGCLEYDPNLSQPKKHRLYLKQLAKFREAIPIQNKTLLAKIHQTYRVQYIQDIVLPTPSVFMEDNMLNTLSSFIFFNKVEIVTLIQEDENFLIELFGQLRDRMTPDVKRRDIVLFLKEFCNFAGNLQPMGKDTFYKTLISLGVLPALEITLAMDDQRTKSASIDILTSIVEYSPSLVRDYTIQQDTVPDAESMLVNVALLQMLSDAEPELGGAVQLMGIIRILLDPENMLASVNKSEKTDFLNFFYKYSIRILVGPLIINTASEKPLKQDYHTAQMLGLILELLSFCVEHHTYHIKNFILQKDLLERILVLMKSNHTFLVLGALRFVRKAIAMKDEFYNRQIVRCNLFAPIVDAFIRNNGRYNLLESAILEFFEFIKVEDIKSLCSYFVEKFGKIFDEIEYVQTFKGLKNKYDQQERFKDKMLDSIPIIRNIRRRDQRQMDEEEEIWFNEDDDFSDVPTTNSKTDLDTTLEVANGPKASHISTNSNSNSPPPTTAEDNSTASASANATTTSSSSSSSNSSSNDSSSGSSPTTSSLLTIDDQNQPNNNNSSAQQNQNQGVSPLSIDSSCDPESNSGAPNGLEHHRHGQNLRLNDDDDDDDDDDGGVQGSTTTAATTTPVSSVRTTSDKGSNESGDSNGSSSSSEGGNNNGPISFIGVTATSKVVAEAAEKAVIGGASLSSSCDSSSNHTPIVNSTDSMKKALVDYENDSDDEEEDDEAEDEDDDVSPQQKRARLT